MNKKITELENELYNHETSCINYVDKNTLILNLILLCSLAFLFTDKIIFKYHIICVLFYFIIIPSVTSLTLVTYSHYYSANCFRKFNEQLHYNKIFKNFNIVKSYKIIKILTIFYMYLCFISLFSYVALLITCVNLVK